MGNLILSTASSPEKTEPFFPVGSEPWADYFEPRWYAAYTWANHEKRVAEQLRRRKVEHFLPLYETVHRWKDRRVRLHLPLFPGYVFVRLALRNRLHVLQVPSVVRLVGFGGLPAALPEQEIETLRNGLSGGFRAQPHPYLTVGRRVGIRNGPLAGMEGILLRRKGNSRVVLSVDLIMRSIAVEADAADLMPQPTISRRGGVNPSTRVHSAQRQSRTSPRGQEPTVQWNRANELLWNFR